MQSIVVLADSRRWNSYYQLVFPLYKWSGLLKKHGYNVYITADKNDKRLKMADIAIITSKAFSGGWQNIERRNRQNEEELFTYLKELKKTVKRLVWHERSATTGSTDFPLIKYVDVFMKNQIMKDLSFYTHDNGAYSVRPWLTDTINLQDHFKKYFPCPDDQLHKIKLGWNLGLLDYRVFLGKKYLSNYFFTNPKFYKSSADRRLDFSFRGAIDYGTSISYQRNKVIELLREITKYKSVLSAEKLDKAAFIKEIAESKVCLSPFGWGEVCYRDFEVFSAGALLFKPSMNYMNTFPDIFIENETYIPFSLEEGDLIEKLTRVLDNYADYIHIAQNGQNLFSNAINDGEAFVKHFLKSIT